MRKPGSFLKSKEKNKPDQPNLKCPAMKAHEELPEDKEVAGRREAQENSPAKAGKPKEVSDA
jgi:hypothetical protein